MSEPIHKRFLVNLRRWFWFSGDQWKLYWLIECFWQETNRQVVPDSTGAEPRWPVENAWQRRKKHIFSRSWERSETEQVQQFKRIVQSLSTAATRRFWQTKIRARIDRSLRRRQVQFPTIAEEDELRSHRHVEENEKRTTLKFKWLIIVLPESVSSSRSLKLIFGCHMRFHREYQSESNYVLLCIRILILCYCISHCFDV